MEDGSRADSQSVSQALLCFLRQVVDGHEVNTIVTG